MIEQLEPSFELELISKAKAGDNEATQILLDQYEPALRASMRKTYGTLDRDEARSAAYSALIEAVWKFDPARHNRLATIIKITLTQELEYESKTKQTFTIPERSLSRYWNILRKADGNHNKAADIADQHGMTRSTWLSIHSSVTSTHLPQFSDTEQEPVYHSVFCTAQDPADFQQDTLKTVFEFLEDENDLTPEEIEVLGIHYGLLGVDCQKDYGHTSAELGLPRKEVIRLHTSAINKARRRLNINQ